MFADLSLENRALKDVIEKKTLKPAIKRDAGIYQTRKTNAECLHRTYQTETLDFYLFRTLNETSEITEYWLTEYNSERPHESLNNLKPEEYQLMTEKPDISKSAWN